jgi:cytochrome c biogenesis protein CcmG/thiol:disulfide interchange protein DsbE
MVSTWISRQWNLSTLVLLGLGLVWIGLTAAQTAPTTQGQTPSPREGFMAPPFRLTTLAGEEVSLDAQKGKVVILNIWATWCAFCETEMPAFENAYEALVPQNEVVIIAVNSTVQDSASAVRSFAARKGLQFPIPLDPDGRVTHLYQVRALPTTYFIDRQGIIRDVIIGGPLTSAMIQSRAAALISREP